MKERLKSHLELLHTFNPDWTTWRYDENINVDALSDEWLKNGTSYIYKVGVLCAIDSNKCDWVWVAIGTQRSHSADIEVKGMFHFCEGENDDMGRTILRALELCENIHPAFN